SSQSSLPLSIPTVLPTPQSPMLHEGFPPLPAGYTPREATAAAPGNSTGRKPGEHEVTVTYPSRLIYYLNEESESTYRDLDTRTRSQDVHLAQASFQLDAFGTTFTLDLTLNNDLLSSDYVEIHYDKDKPVLSRGGEHCYYHGHVRGKEDSRVALSTCNGLHAMLSECIILILLFFKMPRNIFEEMKYLEIMIVADHNTFKRHKSKKHTRNSAKSVVNFVDAIFKEQLNTRVVLVAVEIWTDRDRIPLSVKPLEMLSNFSKYRQQNININADAVHLFTGIGVNEFGSTWTMAASLSQSLAQNLGIQWDPVIRRSKFCGCMDSWVGCIMEDTGVQHPRRFSKCSITDYRNFLLRGGASCLFNKPNKLFEATECGNGYVEVGEECDCGARMECYKDCCKKCSLSNGAHCSDGPCCNSTCLFYPRGYKQRLPSRHDHITISNTFQIQILWIYSDVFCGYLLCTNTGRNPRIGTLRGDVTPTTFNHQGRLVDCSGGHVLLDDDTDLGYVEDGTPCGPSMMCLERKCLPISSLNLTACPSGPGGRVCSSHGVCNNEATCTCDATWAGTDCSMHDPPKEPPVTEDPGPKGPSATNLIIGSIAGAILMAAIVLGGTGWGFKNVKKRRYDPNASAI
uniref:ADAM metallopeptidase domain 23 n=1 Tax=Sinocyclocheilus grahami TaxID=75366 RepID=A0A672LTY7_SINGR